MSQLDDISSIYCIGRNYADHIAELGNERPKSPLVFLKSQASLRSCKSKSFAVFPDESFHHEIEVVVKIDRNYKGNEIVAWEDLSQFTLGLDLTRREIQSQLKTSGLPWTLSKSFAGAAVVGDFVKLTDVSKMKNLTFSLSVNGEVKQQGSVQGMIWSIPELLTYINTFSPLRKNDIVFTGTPKGVGPIKYGDEFVLKSPQLDSFMGTL